MYIDLKIKNGILVSSGTLTKADVGINHGKIVAIGKNRSLPTSEVEINAKGKYILPGCIDVHVHFREPLRTDKENWLTGSTGAAYGGITTVLDMPESVDPTIEGINKKAEEANKKSLVDFGLYGRPTNIHDIHTQKEAGVIAFKILLGYENFYLNSGDFYKILSEIGKTNLPSVIHAEDIVIIKALEERLRAENKKDIVAHELSRPEFVEVEAITRSILLANAAGCKIHIAHLSTLAGMEKVKEAKDGFLDVTAETCPHYLLLDEADLKRLGPYGKINPPVRGKSEDIEGLWRGLGNGTVDCIATDHAPHLISEKDVGWDDIFEAAPGVIGVETMLPLMLTEVNRGRLPIEKLVELTSTNPAKIFNLYPRKGSIHLGSDADLIIVDMEKKGHIHSESLHSKMPFTPYEDWSFKGAPETTIIRGEVVIDDGELLVKPGYGKWIKPIQ